jgi:peptidoglycan hydrolase-like protein with peptidoglycan-binding domain
MKKIIITESEKNRILGLHSFNKKIVKESTVKDIQSILVQNKGYNLGQSGVNKDGVDGIVGNKTLTAIEDFLNKSTPISGETPVADVEPIQPLPAQQVAPETPQLAVTPEVPAQPQSIAPTEPVVQPKEKKKLFQRFRRDSKPTPDVNVQIPPSVEAKKGL